MRGVGLALALAACAAPADAAWARHAELRAVVASADARGAYGCAPRELALARAHLALASRALERGDVPDAEAELRLAAPNARAALRMTPEEGCRGDAGGVARPLEGPRERREEGADADDDGLPDARDFCPAEAEDRDGFLDGDGCPDEDDDLDGTPDGRDACPRAPEDPDGFEDEDGCPDEDDDGDGVADLDDRCPDDPGPRAEAGCPRTYEGVEVRRDALRLREPLRFAPGSARILPASFGLLNAVAQALRDAPRIRADVVVGAGEGVSRELARARARAVRTYLIRLGIAPGRLGARAGTSPGVVLRRRSGR